MKFTKILIRGTASLAGVLSLALSASPVMAAPTFNDTLLQFAGGGATKVIDFNQGSSKIFNDSQLYIATDDWMILQAGQVIVSNDLAVGGTLRGSTTGVHTGNVVGNVTGNTTGVHTGNVTAGTLTGITGLTVSSGGATITAGGLTVNGGTATFGATTPVHLASAQTTAPTAAVSVTGLSAASVAGTDTKGIVTTTGTPSATGTVTVTFNAAYSSAPVVVISPANASGAAALAHVSSTTSTFVITTTAATPGATPSWAFHAIQ